MSKFFLAFAIIAVCLVAAQAVHSSHSTAAHAGKTHEPAKTQTAQPGVGDHLDDGEHYFDASDKDFESYFEDDNEPNEAAVPAGKPTKPLKAKTSPKGKGHQKK
uniref:SSSGP-1C1 n=1 Tax=Mayetiola destructor TaxID=39758 RepID=D1MLP5_MAYDE|nr:SSSGP-1C1 [Mayetiola destructor]